MSKTKKLTQDERIARWKALWDRYLALEPNEINLFSYFHGTVQSRLESGKDSIDEVIDALEISLSKLEKHTI